MPTWGNPFSNTVRRSSQERVIPNLVHSLWITLWTGLFHKMLWTTCGKPLDIDIHNNPQAMGINLRITSPCLIPDNALDWSGSEFLDPTDIGVALPEEKFYVASTDGKGHGKLIHVQVPPQLAARLADFVASRQIPQYRTREDMMRDAIVKLLISLDNLNYQPFKAEVLAAEIRRMESEVESATQTMIDIRRGIRAGLTTKEEAKESYNDFLNHDVMMVRHRAQEFLDEL